ncbi:hypothetical protein [Olavius algarvensis spirochete endosymbiont]|uniref:hypothetical protein n=1 Tax=Olavius algarvensis spirochete endosymbiont TaxID=260710 RepID=UPI000F51A647|nr:hypothetical protein [Olavius algarvensis spirochete endosymbiont]
MGFCLSVMLNGSRPTPAEIEKFIHSTSDPIKLQLTGGYLFKSCVADEILHIGIVPAISENERLHHYDVGVPCAESLIGTISNTGNFSILFRADKSDMDEVIRKKWQLSYIAFAKFLVVHGYAGKGDLDWISKAIIAESGIFNPIPQNIFEIAGLEDSYGL